MSRQRVNPALVAAVAAGLGPSGGVVSVSPRHAKTQHTTPAVKTFAPVDSMRGVSSGRYMGAFELHEHSRRRRRQRNTHPRKRRGGRRG